ncbi:MAG: 23S rRNA (pseudouridine(1915)-N(3))-methyltransferase RlmH [Steroidobacteraceae bacterium]
MRARLIAVGTRPPAWVREACADYTRRLGSRLKVTLVEIEPGPRSSGQSPRKAVEAEGRKLLTALRPDEWVVALDERGTQMSTRELANWLAGRMREGRDLAFLIGGPDGFAAEVVARSDMTLSLSRFTLPHALARVVLAEQLYRAMTILTHHPYHRE